MRRISVLAAGFLASVWGAAPLAAHPLSDFTRAASAELRAARVAAEKGDWATAASASHRSGDASGPQMARWLRLQDERAADFESAAAWLAEHKNWPAEAVIRRIAERKMPGDVQPARVVAFFGGQDPLTAQGALRLSDALRALGREGESAAVAAKAWAGAVFTAGEEQEMLTRHGAALTRAHEARLDRLLWENRLTEAQRMLPRVGSEARRLAEARMALLRGQGEANAVLAALPVALRSHPGIAHGRMIWRNAREMTADAQTMLLETTRAGALGVPARWAERRRVWSRQAYEQKQYRRAYELAVPHGLEAGVDQSELDWFAGWMALRHTGDYASARKLFIAVHDGGRMPITRARGAYWAGEAAARGGDPQAARQWLQRAAAYSTTFYGQLAATKLGAPPVDDLRAPKIGGAPPSPQASDWREATRLGFAIAASGDQRRAQDFFAALARATDDEAALRTMGQAAIEAELWGVGVTIGKQAMVKGVLLPNASFPKPPLPSRVGCGGRVEPAFIYAIIRQESEFNAGAISRSGARGLMQLMPPTAREVGRSIGVAHDAASLTGDPNANIRLGACYLERMLDQFDGSIILAAAAYNAGPNRARQWLGTLGDPRAPGVDPVDWVESIPFNETRNYVQRVVEGYYVYRFRLGEPAPDHRLAQR